MVRDKQLNRQAQCTDIYHTANQAAKILSNELGCMIRYVQIPFERIRESNEDMARMYEWYEKVGTGIDIPNLHQKYPEVNWRISMSGSSPKTRMKLFNDIILNIRTQK